MANTEKRQEVQGNRPGLVQKLKQGYLQSQPGGALPEGTSWRDVVRQPDIRQIGTEALGMKRGDVEGEPSWGDVRAKVAGELGGLPPPSPVPPEVPPPADILNPVRQRPGFVDPGMIRQMWRGW